MKFHPSLHCSISTLSCTLLALGLGLQDASAKGKAKMGIELSENSSSWSSMGESVKDWKVEVGGRFNSDEYSLDEQIAALLKAIEVDEKLLARELPIHLPLEVTVGNWGNETSLKKQNQAIEELLKGYRRWQELGVNPFQYESVQIGNERMDTELSLEKRIEALSGKLQINLALEEMDIDPSKLVKVEVSEPWNWESDGQENLNEQKLGAMQNHLAYLQLIQRLKVDLEKKVEADYSEQELKTALEELLPGAELKFEGIEESVTLAKFEVDGAELGEVLDILNEGAGVYFHFSKEGITIADKPRLP